MTDATVLAVSGMTFESRIAEGPGVTTLHGYRDRRLEAKLGELLGESLGDLSAQRAGSHCGVISIGVAGGLAPRLPPGTVIVAASVQDGDTLLPCDRTWHDALRAALPHALSGPIAGMDAAVTSVADKAALHRTRNALAVDMESHIAARAARDRGLPFAALRIVIDPAERPVPPLAVAGMAADGSTDIGAILLGLLKAPWELGGLMRLGRDAAAAKAALARARAMAGQTFGLA